MKGTNDRHSRTAEESRPAFAEVMPRDANKGSPAEPAPTEAKHIRPSVPVDQPGHPEQHDASATSSPRGIAPDPPAGGPPSHPRLKWLLLAGAVVGLGSAGYILFPWVVTALNTVSTDDAYVNSHVTFVAPRVVGQVSKVLVDDNYYVKKGDVLVELDSEPYRVQVAIKKAAVEAAETNLAAAQAQVRGQVAQARANRYKLEHAIEDVDNQIANLRASVATLNSRKATLELAQANLKRGEEFVPHGSPKQGRPRSAPRRRTRSRGRTSNKPCRRSMPFGSAWACHPSRPRATTLPKCRPSWIRTSRPSGRRWETCCKARLRLVIFPASWTATPKETVATFYKQDPEGNLNRIYTRLIPQAPAIKEAEARLHQAQRDLDEAELNLRYCVIVSEIDGVVTGRSVNPGNNVQVGQSLMAVRSLTEIWIDANFKETQLARLRIGQRVRCKADMYGKRQEFEGRITGFTMGTGETLSLLPPQNATGNFVKIVQRLPVRIELTDYDPDRLPLFVGLSVVPYVYYKEPPAGRYAGAFLQRISPLARRSGTSGSLK